MKKVSLFMLIACLIFNVSAIFADTLYLNGGAVAEGKVVQETNDAYILQQGNAWQKINKADVIFSGTNSDNTQRRQIDLDLILKFGRDLSSKANISRSDGLNGMYDATNKYYTGLEFDIRAFSIVYLGLGFNLSNKGYFSVNDSLEYYDVPYYLLVKLKHNTGHQSNLYVSFNLGMHSLQPERTINNNHYRRDEIVKDNSKMYYGLNIGFELKDILIEIGFISAESAMYFYNNNGRNRYDLVNQSVVLSIGYKIL
ncbi:MAG: hypothetical protein LBL00_02335 [Endomicrobium sp.]|jgi:hypothetical protein|nr:hypothetical protein [Endomicrobium sp.]